MHRRLLLSAVLAAVGLQSAAQAANVLLVIDASTINASESARKSQFESWGHTVTTIQDSASQASFDAAVTDVDVVYVPSTVLDWELGTKVKNVTQGVVCEERYLDASMGFSTSLGWHNSLTQIEILDNTHDVTTGLSVGWVTIVSSSQELAMMNDTKAAGMSILAKQNYAAGNMLGVIESGGALAGGGSAAGRRVRMPWGGDWFDWSALNSNGLLIAQQALSWAAGGAEELVAHWRLDETSGTTAADDTGNGHDGTVTGTASWGAAMRNNGFVFDGSTKIEASGLLGQPANVTVAAWANLSSADSSGAEVVSLGDHVILRLDSSSASGAAIYNGSTWRTLNLAQTFAGTGWRHFAVVFDDDNDLLKLYVDGALAASKATTDSISYSGLGANTVIGRHGNGSSSFDFTGMIDDVRVYNYALSDAQIVELYGLMGHWKLDEASGTAAADSSPMANDASYQNGVVLNVEGPYPGITAADLDGADDDVAVPNEDLYDGVTEEITIAMWFRVDAFDLGWQALVSKGDNAWRISRNGTTDTLHFGVNSNSTGKLNGAVNVNDGQWHHVAATYDGATMKLYIDGQLDSTKSSTDAIATNDYAIQIGANSQTSGRNFEGALRDVRLYSRALNEWEIAELYGLVGHWKLDEPSGTTATDSSLVGNDGGYANGAAPAAAGPYPGDGASAAVFDGTTAHVEIAPHDAYHHITETIAVAGWVYFDTAVSGQSQQELVISKSDGSSNTGFVLMTDQPYSNRLVFRVYDGSTYADAAWDSPDIGAGEWHHIVGSYDGAEVKLYVDGQLKGTASYSSALVPYAAGNLNLGYAQDGRLFDARLYNRPLSDEEIAKLYGLVAHWKLDESTGGVAYDASGMGNDAVLTGAQGWTEGQTDGGFAFDYTNGEEYFTAPSNNTLDNLQEGDYSVAAYFKPNSVPPGFGADNDSTYGILMKTGWHIGLGFNYDAELQTEDWLTGDVWNGAGAWEAHATGKFYHVAGVVSRAEGTVKIYVDGVLKETAIFTPGTASRDFGTTPWRIGVGEPGGVAYGYPCDGVIDDARLYNRALSADEVEAVYQSGQPTGLRIIRWVEAR